jgi:hypothetical protein
MAGAQHSAALRFLLVPPFGRTKLNGDGQTKASSVYGRHMGSRYPLVFRPSQGRRRPSEAPISCSRWYVKPLFFPTIACSQNSSGRPGQVTSIFTLGHHSGRRDYRNFGSGNLGFKNRYSKIYIKFLLPDILGSIFGLLKLPEITPAVQHYNSDFR